MATTKNGKFELIRIGGALQLLIEFLGRPAERAQTVRGGKRERYMRSLKLSLVRAHD